MVNEKYLQFGEDIGTYMAIAGTEGDMATFGKASTILYKAKLGIANNPDSLERQLLKRDVNVGVKCALRSRGFEPRNVI